jgi:uncharacterized membrane protein
LVQGLVAAAVLIALAACGQGVTKDGATDGGGPVAVDAEKELAALGPPADAQTTSLYQGTFEAAGSEPSWRLDMLDDWVAFTRPGLQEVGGLPSRKDFRAQGARYVAGPLVITIKATPCQYEGGENYPYTASVNYEGVAYDGCARRGSSETASWATRINEWLPTIDACLAKAANKPARVTIAYERAAGRTNVRIEDGQGGRYECAVEGGKVVDWDDLADRDVLQGENEPIFSRAGTAAPQKACAKSVEAKDAAGKVIGLLTNMGC